MASAEMFAAFTLSIVFLSSVCMMYAVVLYGLKEATSASVVAGREDAEIEVESVVRLDAYTLAINLTNHGPASLRLSDLGEVDLILSYRSGGAMVHVRLRYSESGGADTWRCVSVYFDNVNPANPAESEGLWDPDEVLGVVVQLSRPVDENSAVTVVVCSPFGSRDVHQEVV